MSIFPLTFAVFRGVLSLVEEASGVSPESKEKQMMLTTQEFANHWGVAVKTVRRWISDELINAEQPYPGAPYRIPEEELYTFHPSDARQETSAGLGNRLQSPKKSRRLEPWKPKATNQKISPPQPKRRASSYSRLVDGECLPWAFSTLTQLVPGDAR